MDQLPLFRDEDPLPLLTLWRLGLVRGRPARREEEAVPILEDPIGLYLARLPVPPVGDPAFERFGLFVEELPRTELPNCRAEHWVSLPLFSPR